MLDLFDDVTVSTVWNMRMTIFMVSCVTRTRAPNGDFYDCFTLPGIVLDDDQIDYAGAFAEKYLQHRKVLMNQIAAEKHKVVGVVEARNRFERNLALLLEQGHLMPLPCPIDEIDRRMDELFMRVQKKRHPRSESDRKKTSWGQTLEMA